METTKKVRMLKGARCPVCGCSVIAYQPAGVAARLVRALAMEDHRRTLHVAPKSW